jgi:hypothetical protein
MMRGSDWTLPRRGLTARALLAWAGLLLLAAPSCTPVQDSPSPNEESAPTREAVQALSDFAGFFESMSALALPDLTSTPYGPVRGRAYPILKGWLCDKNNPGSQRFDVYSTNVCLTTGCPADPTQPVFVGRYGAQVPRADVQTQPQGSCAPIADARYGFEMPLPSTLDDGRKHSISLFPAGTGTPLAGGPRTLRTNAPLSGQFGYVDKVDSTARQISGWVRQGFRVHVYATNTSGDGNCIAAPSLPQNPSPPARICRVIDAVADGFVFQVSHPNYTGPAQWFTLPLPGYLLDDPASGGDSHTLYGYAFDGADGTREGRWLPDVSTGATLGVNLGTVPLTTARAMPLDLGTTRQSLHRRLWDGGTTVQQLCDQGIYGVPLPPESTVGSAVDGAAAGSEPAMSCPVGSSAEPIPFSTTASFASHLQSYFGLCNGQPSCNGYTARLSQLDEGLSHSPWGAAGSLVAWDPVSDVVTLYNHPGWNESVNQFSTTQTLSGGIGVGDILSAAHTGGQPCPDGFTLDDDNLDGQLCSAGIRWGWDFVAKKLVASGSCPYTANDQRCLAFDGADPGWQRGNGRRLRISSDIFVPAGCPAGHMCGRYLSGRAAIYADQGFWMRKVRHVPPCLTYGQTQCASTVACKWDSQGQLCHDNTSQFQIASRYAHIGQSCQQQLSQMACAQTPFCEWSGSACVRSKVQDYMDPDSDPSTRQPIFAQWVSGDSTYINVYGEPAAGSAPFTYDPPAVFVHHGFDITYEHVERMLEEACLGAAMSADEAIQCRDGRSLRWGRPEDWNLAGAGVLNEGTFRTAASATQSCTVDTDCPTGEWCSPTDQKCAGYATLATTFRNAKVEVLQPQ